jgi:Putative Ig domain
MSASFRETKWLGLVMMAAVGFGLLVLTIGSIDQRMGLLPREQREGSQLSRNASSATPLADPPAQAWGLAPENEEQINENDSPEERIRKQFGMVKLGGVWLPAIPIKSAAAAGKTNIGAGPEGGIAYAVPLYITTGKLPEGTAGERYQFRIEAVGGVPPYLWSIERGAPVDSISLGRSSGELSGTPSNASTTTFRVRVTDAAGAADIAEYRMRVTDTLDSDATARVTATNAQTAAVDPAVAATTSQPPGEPSTDMAAPTSAEEVAAEEGDPDAATAPLVIISSALADGMVGEAYSAQLAASGGTPPYAWSSLGQLPAGLSLTAGGVLSGTPQAMGEFTLNVGVTDQAGKSLARGIALKIAAAVPDSVTNFTALVSLRKVALSWTNPADPTVVAVRILRNGSNPPANELDGAIVFEGQGTSVLDPSPPSGGAWYSAFALSADQIASEPAHLAVELKLDAEPFADAVVSRNLLHAQAYNSQLLPGIVLGAPKGGGIGAGSLDVVSLGAASVDDPGGAPYGGSITVSFENNLAFDGPGADFTIFENVFYIKGAAGYDPNSRMMEPAIVSVSQDGVAWHTFPFDFSPRYDAKTGALNLRHPFVYNKGFAGVNPVIANGNNVDPTDPAVSGGDSFDLADLRVPGLAWIRYVRIQSTGEKWMVDADGDLVRHSNTTALKEASRASPTSGFDLDAVTAIWLDAVR